MAVGISFMIGPTIGTTFFKDYYQATALACFLTIVSGLILLILPTPMPLSSFDQSSKKMNDAHGNNNMNRNNNTMKMNGITSTAFLQTFVTSASLSKSASSSSPCLSEPDLLLDLDNNSVSDSKQLSPSSSIHKTTTYYENNIDASPSVGNSPQQSPPKPISTKHINTTANGHVNTATNDSIHQNNKIETLKDHSENTNNNNNNTNTSSSWRSSMNSFFSLFHLPVAQTTGAKLLFFMRTSMAFAFSIFMTVWTVTLKERFNFQAKDHAYFMGWIGLCYAISQGLLARYLLQLFGGKTSTKHKNKTNRNTTTTASSNTDDTKNSKNKNSKNSKQSTATKSSSHNSTSNSTNTNTKKPSSTSSSRESSDSDPTFLLLLCMLILSLGRVCAMLTHSVVMVYGLMALVIISLGVVNTAMSSACGSLAGPDQVGLGCRL